MRFSGVEKSDVGTILLFILATAISVPISSALATASQRGITISAKTADGQKIPLYAESHALLIGASHYRRGWPVLPGVIKDIEQVRRVLKIHKFHIETILDPDSVQLGDAIESFINRYGNGVDNRLLFYFAGHGHTLKLAYGEEMGYIVPVDAPNPDVDLPNFFATALDMQQIEVYAKRIQSKHALFVFDSCFSGSIFALSRAIPENISYKTAKPVRQFLTSGSANETVPDKSVFVRQFVDGLSGEADINEDGYITGTELGEFLQNTVVNYSRGNQHPQYGKIRNRMLDKGDFVFVRKIDRRPAARTAQAGYMTNEFELSFWNSIKDSQDPQMYEAYLHRFPDGTFAELARLKIAKYSKPVDDPHKAIASLEPESELPVSTPAQKWKVAILPFHFESYADELKNPIVSRTIKVVDSLNSFIVYSYYDILGVQHLVRLAATDVDTTMFENMWQKESFLAPFEPDVDLACETGKKLKADYVITGKVNIGPTLGSDYRKGGIIEIFVIDSNRKKKVNKRVMSSISSINTATFLMNYERSLKAYLGETIAMGFVNPK